MVPPASAVAPDSVALSEMAVPRLTDCVADVAMPGCFLSTTKHSVVVFVCVPARYLEPAAGVYSTRKQYSPTAVGVYASDVAAPLESVLVAPTLVPPVVQSGVEPD